jgi:indolepyruvate ferredoxin oxidoreductase alpha subunit
MSKSLLNRNPGHIALLMGNEALARGAIESGVSIAAAYPGTHSSEIGISLARVAKNLDLYFEWSTNEKVAFEVAYGASMCGLKSLVSMKHVGLNVAADILNPVSLRGVTGGLIIAVADDPSKHSSRTEQDTRWYAKLNGVPVIEPSSPQEAKDYTILSYEVSEKFKTPVILRMVTRLSHMRSNVTLGKISEKQNKGEFDFNSYSRRLGTISSSTHLERNKKNKKIEEYFENINLNEVKKDGDEKFGVIGSGFAYSYVYDAIKTLKIYENIAQMKLVTTYPVPEKLLFDFLKDLDEILIAEEVDPFIELHIKSIAKDANPNIKINGRMNSALPEEGELSTELIVDAITDMMDLNSPIKERKELEKEISKHVFTRMRTMCAGCPHRATSYALKTAVQNVKGDLSKVVINGDIGCYSLVSAPPISFMDTAECMGASISVSQGMAHSETDTVPITWIGDGTFFHSGIPGLINAVYNQAEIKVVIADNSTTAMTGFQENPQTGKTAMGDPTKKIMIEDIAKACGVEFIRVADPNNLAQMIETFEDMLNYNGLSVVISRRLCATEEMRMLRPQRPVPFAVNPDTCIGCKICLTTYGCPSFIWSEDERIMKIDTSLCLGCGVCSQICPVEAIAITKEEA